MHALRHQGLGICSSGRCLYLLDVSYAVKPRRELEKSWRGCARAVVTNMARRLVCLGGTEEESCGKGGGGGALNVTEYSCRQEGAARQKWG